ncbi:hypothetical protein BS47DRAFT_1215946 [Hydnum rufescens UP504]|uniref:Uncharacterized protein n=1 Tax=Hydnum rufescens UP504 TaxID=1448309 RepID=A0A9P6AS78_9AGAM|nr:hypothetical protein BS47DRAFT_1215946 [Hydnum rufescens UP504]
MAPIISLFERADYGPTFTHVQHSKSGLVAAAIGSGLLALVIIYAYGARILLAFLCFFFPCWFKEPPPSTLAYRRELFTHIPITSPAMRWNDRIDPPPAYASTSSLPSFSERDPSLPSPRATGRFNTAGIEAPCSIPLAD